MKSVPLLALALGVLADVEAPATTDCLCAVSSAECSTKYLELFSCWTAAGGNCRLSLDLCPAAQGQVRLPSQGCGAGGQACPSDYECRVPGTNGVGLCTPNNMGAGFNYGNIVVNPPPTTPQLQQLPAWPVAGAAAPPPRPQSQPMIPAPSPAAPPAAGPPLASAPAPAAPVAVQPPRPTTPPPQQLSAPKPVAVAPPPRTVTVTGVPTPRGQNPPRPVREPPSPYANQPAGPAPYPYPNAQPVGPAPYPYPNAQPGLQPPPPFANQPAGPAPYPFPNTQPGRPAPYPFANQPPRQPQQPQQGGPRPYSNQPVVQAPPRGQAPPPRNPVGGASGGRKLPLKVGRCTERERATARCRLTDLCFPHPVRPVCVNPTASDDCGYSRNQKLFGRSKFKECKAGEMCLADYRATDGDDGICAIEPR